MVISSALNNALSGLSVVARQSDVISANLANAATPGYARRELDISSSLGRVQIDGVVRITDPVVVSERREASSDLSMAQSKATFFEDVERVIGTPDEESSLNGRIALLEASLIEAAAQPEDESRLRDVLSAAEAVAENIANASAMVQSARSQADSAISQDVETLNTTLQSIHHLNVVIQQGVIDRQDISSLEDQRQRLIDDVSTIVPVRLVARENNQVALYGAGGLALLDQRPVQLSFSPAPLITPEMSRDTGALAEIAVDGRPVGAHSLAGSDGGGTLATHFDIRDTVAPHMQARLDGLAYEILVRFEGVADAQTPSSLAAGFFTDLGARSDASTELGLAARISVNDAVNPDRGGELFRIREGLDRATPSDAFDATLLNHMIEAMALSAPPVSAVFGTKGVSLSALASDTLSYAGTSRQDFERQVAHHGARLDYLTEDELASGVDTDHELQKLLLVENSYAANARVIRAIEQMMATILEI